MTFYLSASVGKGNLLLNARFPFKRDPRNVIAGVEPMLAGVFVAVLHVVLKTRVGEMKILGNDILALPICSEGLLQFFRTFVFKTDTGEVNLGVERMIVSVTAVLVGRGSENASR